MSSYLQNRVCCAFFHKRLSKKKELKYCKTIENLINTCNPPPPNPLRKSKNNILCTEKNGSPSLTCLTTIGACIINIFPAPHATADACCMASLSPLRVAKLIF